MQKIRNTIKNKYPIHTKRTYLFCIIAVLTGVFYANSQIKAKDTTGVYYTINIDGPDAALAVNVVEASPVKEHNTDTGAIEIKVKGGWPNYQYFIYKDGDTTAILSGAIIKSANNPESSITKQNLYPGNYTVVVRDSKYTSGRTCNEVSGSITLSNPAILEVTPTISEIIQCNSDTGIIKAEASGGLPKNGIYTYELLKTGPTAFKKSLTGTGEGVSFTGLSEGTYTVKVSDQYTSTISGNLELVNPAVLSLPPENITTTSVTCNGGSDGTITVTPKGGIKPYTVAVYLNNKLKSSNEGNTSIKISNLQAKSYMIRVTDEYDCPSVTIYDITVGQPTNPINIAVVNQQTKTAPTNNDGKVELKVTGGTEGYTYSFTGAVTSSHNKTGTIAKSGGVVVFDGLSKDNYTFKVTDATGKCSKSIPITITDPKKLVVNVTHTNVKCFGETTGGKAGTVTANVDGGFTKVYQYKWFKKATNGSFTQIPQTSKTIQVGMGEYKVEASVLSNGVVLETKESENTATVTEPTQLELTQNNITINNVTCKGFGNGSIIINPTGGAGNYTYLWSNGKTTKNISSLIPGKYDVTITDENGCSIDVDNIQITEPTENLAIAIVDYKDLLVNGAQDGYINASVTGGNSGYVYEWKNEKGEVKGTSKNLTNISGGIYTLTVTDAKGCKKSISQELKEPLKLEANIQVSSGGEISCKGARDGNLEVLVTGGIEGYTYKWFEVMNGNKNYLTGENSNLLQGKAKGEYGVEVTDRDGVGIMVETRFNLEEPDSIAINTKNTKVTHVKCYGESTGSIQIDVVGGTPYKNQDGTTYYKYNWYEINDTSTVVSTSKNPIGLASGFYIVEIIDSKNCKFKLESSKAIEITQPTKGLAITDVLISDATGFGKNNGVISIEVSGGTGPYLYKLTKKSDNSVDGSTKEVKGLEGSVAGIVYVMTVTDANDCRLSKEYTIKQPEELKITGLKEQAPVRCHGESNGELVSEVSGGFLKPGENYTYQWYKLPDETTVKSSISNIVGDTGLYKLVVSDSNGNTTFSTIELTQPTPLKVTYHKQDVLLCYGATTGSIDITVEGGNGNYFYKWNTGANTEDLSNLPAGKYEVNITDAKGCTIKSETIEINQPKEYKVKITTYKMPSGAGLQDGEIAIEILGGTLNKGQSYIIEWTDSNGLVIGNSLSISNLKTGDYFVKITDSNDCILKEKIFLREPEPLVISIEQLEYVKCNNALSAVLRLNTEGGVGGNSYTWYNATDNSVIGSSEIMYNLPSGKYYVTVIDANNNQSTSDVFTVTQPDALAVKLDSKSKECGLDGDWTVTANVIGGTPPYSYNWSSGHKTKTLENVSNGGYFVAVRDANGCQITQNITLQPANPLEIKETVTHLTCYDSCEGAIFIQATGGESPYTYKWNTGETTASIKNKCAGNYMVTISDNKGCIVEKNVTIKNAKEFIFEIVPNEVTLCEGETIEYDVTMQGIKEYQWTSTNGFRSNKSFVVLEEEGDYTLTVTTQDNCKVSKVVKVKKSDAKIDAQFILSSQAFVGEDIVFINVSNPISSDVEWNIPSNVQVFQETTEGVVVRFEAPGNYDIQLIAREGSCVKEVTKTINVQKARVLPDAGDSKKPFISQFVVYPNPNKGNFKVLVELVKEAEISLRLFNLSANKIIQDKKLRGLTNYEVQYNIDVASGVYLLLLETSKGSRIQKVIIE